MTSRRVAAPAGSTAASTVPAARTASSAAATPSAAPAPTDAQTDAPEPVPEFPGCRPVRITRDAIADHESRIEYWDAATETAWVACEPNTVHHEGPGQVLSGLLTRIAAIRGAPILTLGAADLLLRDEHGERRRILQADQVVFLDPVETRPRGAAVEVGSDHLPDVVLEVDYATDVRRGKLGLYEAWGFPEVWVEVPEGGSPRRRPGLTVHWRSTEGYRSVAGERYVLPGWTAVEIHAAFNESAICRRRRAPCWSGSAERWARPRVPVRTTMCGWGRSAGKRVRKGVRRSSARFCATAVWTVSERLAARIAGADPDVLAAAALACRDEADLLARLGRRRRADRRTRTRDR